MEGGLGANTIDNHRDREEVERERKQRGLGWDTEKQKDLPQKGERGTGCCKQRKRERRCQKDR